MLLKGIKILEFGCFISAPFASKLLADMGADVTKIEPSNGDSLRGIGPFINGPQRLSGLFLSLNHGKKLLCLNVESSPGREIFLKLVSRSDILIENYGESYWEKIGLPWSQIKMENRNIVIVSLTPFGNKGPYSKYHGQEINVNALSGIVDCIGFPDRKPINIPFHQAFFQQGLNGAAAAVFAHLSVMNGKDRSAVVDISAFDVMSSYVTTHNLIYSTRDIFMKREGRRAAGSAGAYPFTILQGKESPIAIMCPAVGEFKILTEAMGSPEWSKDPRYQNPSEISRHYADEVDAHVEEWISKLSDKEIEEISLKFGIPLYPIRNVDRILEDEQYGYRKYFKEISYGGNSYTIPGLPFSCSDIDGPFKQDSDRAEAEEFAGFYPCSAVAELLARHMHAGRIETITDISIGKDSVEILKDLGNTESSIDEFRRHDDKVHP